MLPTHYALPILLVQHLHPSDGGAFSQRIARMTSLCVVEPCDKEEIQAGHVYTAPANYHMLMERSGSISLSVDERVNWSRPSIDVLFESGARVMGKSVVGILLSGANADGVEGLRMIRAGGGMTIAQDPESSAMPLMPKSAVTAGVADKVLSADQIGEFLLAVGS
jgi:two-component system chemotaxis response regulator CheB